MTLQIQTEMIILISSNAIENLPHNNNLVVIIVQHGNWDM